MSVAGLIRPRADRSQACSSEAVSTASRMGLPSAKTCVDISVSVFSLAFCITSAEPTKLFIAYHFLPKAERFIIAELEVQRAAVRDLVGATPDHEIIRIGSGHREQWPKLREAVRLAVQN